MIKVYLIKKEMIMNFKFKDDEIFFKNLLDFLDEAVFTSLFDFSDPIYKRKTFNKIKKTIYEDLLLKQEGKCYLSFDGICDISKGYQIDHVIPLSTNILNKHLRNITSVSSNKKVQTESYGSNHSNNLILTCKACNQHKKHRILEKEDYQEIFRNKGLL
jgi:5-methylcytosine-specific restriction endonuclease McrA